MEPKNYFEELNSLNVSDKIEKKGGLSYLSWAWAWSELKKRHPRANYEVKTREDGRIYWDDGRTAWVVVSVRVPVFIDEAEEAIVHTEILPIMDARNRSIPVENITSMDANKAIQRALTKAIARHGLGLYIYAGEDLPEAPSDADVKASIDACKNDDELRSIYRTLKGVYANDRQLVAWCAERKKALSESKNETEEEEQKQ